MNEKLFFDIISNYSRTLNNRLWFVSIVRDFFPKERLAANAIISCFDIGIQDIIKTTDVLDEFLFERCTKLLIASYGLKPDVASNAVSTWIRVYGYDYLHKPIEATFIKTLRKYSFDSEINNSLGLETSTLKKNCRIIVELDQLQDGAKLPKELITRYGDVEQQLGVSSIQVGLFLNRWLGNSDGIRLIGEVLLARTHSVHIIMLISIINTKGQVVGTDFGCQIDCPAECRTQSISTEIRVPKGESLSDIKIHFIKNPVY